MVAAPGAAPLTKPRRPRRPGWDALLRTSRPRARCYGSGVSDERPAWRKQLEQSLAELESLGKQIGTKLGDAAKDASQEAKEAWRKLEPRIGEVTSQVGGKLREAKGEAAEQLEGMVSELRSSLKALRDKL